ncbi:MAG: GtrA family protein [Bacilli bacterium]
METKTPVRNKETIIQAVRFTLFSLSAGLIQILGFTLLYELLKWDYLLSYLISLTLSVLWNFTFNRKFTFKSAANVPIAMLKVFAYYLVFTPLSTWGGDALEKIGCPAYLVFVLSMLLNFVTEFLYTKYYVFRGQINTALPFEK